MIINQQANYAKAAVLPMHLVSEFTNSFSFTPSSELYEWTNVGDSEWEYRGRFRIQPDMICFRCFSLKLELNSAGM